MTPQSESMGIPIPCGDGRPRHRAVNNVQEDDREALMRHRYELLKEMYRRLKNMDTDGIVSVERILIMVPEGIMKPWVHEVLLGIYVEYYLHNTSYVRGGCVNLERYLCELYLKLTTFHRAIMAMHTNTEVEEDLIFPLTN